MDDASLRIRLSDHAFSELDIPSPGHYADLDAAIRDLKSTPGPWAPEDLSRALQAHRHSGTIAQVTDPCGAYAVTTEGTAYYDYATIYRDGVDVGGLSLPMGATPEQRDERARAEGYQVDHWLPDMAG